MKQDMTVKEAYDILKAFGELWRVLDPEEKEALREMEREVIAQEQEQANQAEQEPKKK